MQAISVVTPFRSVRKRTLLSLHQNAANRSECNSQSRREIVFVFTGFQSSLRLLLVFLTLPMIGSAQNAAPAKSGAAPSEESAQSNCRKQCRIRWPA